MPNHNINHKLNLYLDAYNKSNSNSDYQEALAYKILDLLYLFKNNTKHTKFSNNEIKSFLNSDKENIEEIRNKINNYRNKIKNGSFDSNINEFIKDTFFYDSDKILESKLDKNSIIKQDLLRKNLQLTIKDIREWKNNNNEVKKNFNNFKNENQLNQNQDSLLLKFLISTAKNNLKAEKKQGKISIVTQNINENRLISIKNRLNHNEVSKIDQSFIVLANNILQDYLLLVGNNKSHYIDKPSKIKEVPSFPLESASEQKLSEISQKLKQIKEKEEMPKVEKKKKKKRKNIPIITEKKDQQELEEVQFISELESVEKEDDDLNKKADTFNKIITNDKATKYKKVEKHINCIYLIQTGNYISGEGMILGNGYKYIGNWENSNFHGKGTLDFLDGEIYEGEFKNGLANGKGKCKHINNDTYEGEFKNGIKEGKGIYKCFQGEVYEGEFKNGIANGKGTLDSLDGEIYEGDIIGGKPHGDGVYKYTNGDVYKGKFKDGIKEGKGVYKHINNEIHEGKFVNDKLNYGIITFDNGNIYEGGIKDNQLNGYGILKFPDGEFYKGEFKNGLANGKGIYKYVSGNIHEGEWKNGMPHGNIKVKYSNGDRFHGKFEYGVAITGEVYYTDGTKYIGKFKNDINNNNPEGKGVFVNKNGSEYRGNYKSNKLGKPVPEQNSIFNVISKNIKGEIIGTYKGTLNEDYKREGQGEFIYTNGDKKIAGKWKNGALLTSQDIINEIENKVNNKINSKN